MIATLATRADAAGIKTCVVSTDRDAFQLCSENVCLMMTPRGVADVNVYTPERVELRYGITPAQIPDFIGLKGDTSDNIPGIPGIGDKTAGQLIAQYGSLESVIEHAGELSPARRKNVTEFADQARVAKGLATMRRDLDLDYDPAEVVLAPPDRSELKEIFRRFEFRGLLSRVDTLDEAIPAAPMAVTGVEVPWREGLLAFSGRVGFAASGELAAIADERGRRRRAAARARRGRPRRPRRQGAARRRRRRHAARRVPDRAGALDVRAARPRGRVRRRAAPVAAGRGGDGGARRRGRGAAPARADAAGAPRGARRDAALPRGRDAAHARARRDGERRREDRHLPHGRDHGAPVRARRRAGGAGVRARGRGVHARLDAAGRAHPLREARPGRRAQGQDGLLDRREGAARPARASTSSFP